MARRAERRTSDFSSARRQTSTRNTASRTMSLDIFDFPDALSVKVMGTSSTSIPARQARHVFSIWKQ
jgi:hypothetical protein